MDNLNKSVYEYYCLEQFRGIHKIAGVITDRQCVIDTGIRNEPDYRSHNDLHIDIYKLIHPEFTDGYWELYRKNNMHVAGDAGQLVVEFPRDDKLSINQAIFLIDILNQIHKFTIDTGKNIKITLFVDWNTALEPNLQSELDTIKEFILSKVTNDYVVDEEVIIGKTIDKVDNDIKADIMVEREKNVLNNDIDGKNEIYETNKLKVKSMEKGNIIIGILGLITCISSITIIVYGYILFYR